MGMARISAADGRGHLELRISRGGDTMRVRRVDSGKDQDEVAAQIDPLGNNLNLGHSLNGISGHGERR